MLKPREQAVPDDVLVITLIYTDIHLNGQQPKGWTASPCSPCCCGAEGNCSFQIAGCSGFEDIVFMIMLKTDIFIFHQQMGYLCGAQELPWSSSHPQMSLQPGNETPTVNKFPLFASDVKEKVYRCKCRHLLVTLTTLSRVTASTACRTASGCW